MKIRSLDREITGGANTLPPAMGVRLATPTGRGYPGPPGLPRHLPLPEGGQIPPLLSCERTDGRRETDEELERSHEDASKAAFFLKDHVSGQGQFKCQNSASTFGGLETPHSAYLGTNSAGVHQKVC